MENSILTERQKKFLEIFSLDKFLSKKFCLSGGTALAGFYLHHRYSEDLDFFSETEFNISELNIFFTKVKKELGIKKLDFNQSYNRNLFFCHFDDEILKIEFTYFPFSKIETPDSKNRLQIESMIDLAVNKLFTIYQRTTARDYIDLYFICKEKGFKINDLVSQAKIKFDWHIDFIQLATQFIKAKDVLDLPKMIKEIEPREWQIFFVKEAEKLKNEIFEE
ncbi:nucleotidyl transferase AbiEii/AbiGii toxin family protein [Candidatus Azambacteria bacterium]|nr:nucleotidyl transferase AbiEii/AbiGii toxin family protein [Candidatus Azambacteria bacterium]